jgi:ATP-dependent RNA helicase SUPV3L1/SUV3
VALITGEEKIVPPRPRYFVCTVEAMPLGREVDFLAVDEIQLCADPERGHVFTDRLLHARGRRRPCCWAPDHGAAGPPAAARGRDRRAAAVLAAAYTGPKKLTRLPRRSAVVAFSPTRSTPSPS